MTQPLDPDLTPDWLKDISVKTALVNLAFDIGSMAARLTMLQQRVNDVLHLIEEEKEIKDETE